MINNFSKICNHNRLKRINDNFVRCLACGESMISQKTMSTNKTRQEFTSENNSFEKNFDRNFNNIIEEQDDLSQMERYEYYTDRIMANKIIVNRAPWPHSHDPIFEVTVNNTKSYLKEDEIKKMLADINAIRVDEYVFKKLKN
jgi:hypothetical protein